MNKTEIYLDSIDMIYNNVYKKINREYIDVFLCGGVSTNNYCIRDAVREKLEKLNIRVLYPEDLFMDILTKDKNMDLLSLENFLADNSDIICVLPESAGSLVELGAFTNNSKTLDKLFVIIDKKYQKDKSFIIMGPIKYILNEKGKERVIFYDIDTIDITIKKVVDRFRRFRRMYEARGKKYIDINTIIGQYYFIPLLIFFTKSISMRNLEKIMARIYTNDNLSMDRLQIVLSSSVKLLYKNKFIDKNIISGEISLTNKGNKYIRNILDNLMVDNRKKLYDYIRYGIMLSDLNANTPLESTMK